MGGIDIYLDLEGIESRGVASMEAEQAATTKLVAALLTAEIYNRYDQLTGDDLPPLIRKSLFDPSVMGVNRPVQITLRVLENVTGVNNVRPILRSLPFVQFEEISLQARLKEFDEAIEWFCRRSPLPLIETNPVLAYFFETARSMDVSYAEARRRNRPLSCDREWIQAKINELYSDGKEAEELLKLVSIKAPEDVRNTLDDLVLTSEQHQEIRKAGKALEHRSYLKDIGLYEIGKLLFIGPPGTGKTSSARALSKWFGMPLVEVKLSMITSQYLGETSKNVDNIFFLAKRLSPCILFIDEFDYVAKTRTSDDHGAIKRAVNTLLKAIDEISLVEDGVLVIAATNHPQLLDYAVWRRFDKILGFSLPDLETRRGILEKILARIDTTADLTELARRTDGYTGSDLRMVVREAVLNALLNDRTKLDQNDLLHAIETFQSRITNNFQNKKL